MSLNFSNLVFWSDPKDERNNNQIPLESVSGSLKHSHKLLSQLPLDPGFRRGDGQALPHISIDWVAPVG